MEIIEKIKDMKYDFRSKDSDEDILKMYLEGLINTAKDKTITKSINKSKLPDSVVINTIRSNGYEIDTINRLSSFNLDMKLEDGVIVTTFILGLKNTVTRGVITIIPDVS